jgi:hypothetical protein
LRIDCIPTRQVNQHTDYQCNRAAYHRPRHLDIVNRSDPPRLTAINPRTGDWPIRMYWRPSIREAAGDRSRHPPTFAHQRRTAAASLALTSIPSP